jgi:hypothetical protein
MDEIFDIEDLSQLLKRRAGVSSTLRELDPEDLSIPISVDTSFVDEPDDTIHIVDTLDAEQAPVYRSPQGRYLRYRIAVLGIGQAVEQIHQQLRTMLDGATDPLIEEHNISVRYAVALFGGKPAEGGVRTADAELLVDRLVLFRANHLVLVNAGQVKHRFADQTPHQLALLSRQINSNALTAGQRPYTLVFVVDKRMSEEHFTRYRQFCQKINTHPAAAQFGVAETSALIEHARQQLISYTRAFLQVREGL